MLSNLTGWHFVVILFIVLLLFGAPKLPALARSLGQSMKIFKSEIRTEPAASDSEASTSPDSRSSDSRSSDSRSSDARSSDSRAAESHTTATTDRPTT